MRCVNGPLNFQTAAYLLHAYLMLHCSNDIGERWGAGTAAPVEPDSADNETRETAAKRPRMEYDDPFGCLEALLEADPVGVSRPTNIEAYLGLQI